MERILIIGCGESGFGAAVLAHKQGHEVFVTDAGRIAEKYRAQLIELGIPFEEGGHTEKCFENADTLRIVVISPGVPLTAPLLVELSARTNARFLSEIQFASEYIGHARTIGITGSNGKTTTTTLIYLMLREAGFNVCMAGNIGNSFAYAVATGHYDWYVLELSSFQLDGIGFFPNDIAVLLNITPDHLDRYENNIELYARSKTSIAREQNSNDLFIYSADDPLIERYLPKYELRARQAWFTAGGKTGWCYEAWVEDGTMMATVHWVKGFGKRLFFMPVGDIRLRGRHNLLNAMAATMAAMAAPATENSLPCLRETITINFILHHHGQKRSAKTPSAI